MQDIASLDSCSPNRIGRTAHCQLLSLTMGVKTVGQLVVVRVISALPSAVIYMEITMHSYKSI